MRKLCLLFIILIGFTTIHSQTAAPKTIFEALGIENESCPIESYPPKEYYDDMIHSSSKIDTTFSDDQLLVAKDRIARHFANLHLDPNKPFVLYGFNEFILDPMNSFTMETIPLGHIVKKGDNYILYTPDNKVIWEKKLSYVERSDPDGFNTYTNSNLSTYYHYTGKVISSGEYEYIIHHNDDYYRVLKNKKWGIIKNSFSSVTTNICISPMKKYATILQPNGISHSTTKAVGQLSTAQGNSLYLL